MVQLMSITASTSKTNEMDIEEGLEGTDPTITYSSIRGTHYNSSYLLQPGVVRC